MSERRSLTIEQSYCSNWSIKDAIREIIQNALDTKTQIDIKQVDDTRWCISDKGAGIQLSDFILGRTSKQDNKTTIGQFGEGLKIGCLVLAREKRRVIILSKDKRYEMSIQYDTTWKDNLLTIDIEDAGNIKGTNVIIECSKEEIESTRNLFLSINPQQVLARTKHGEILNNAGAIYVNGLKVIDIDSIYGYNFHDKTLVNRDRTAIGTREIKDAVARVLSSLTNKQIITGLLLLGREHAEGKLPIELDVDFSPRPIWKTIIYQKWGKKVCLGYEPRSDLRAIEHNWTVLMFPYSFRYSLHYILEYSHMVIKDKEKIIAKKSLSEEDLAFLKKGKRIANKVAKQTNLNTYPIKVFEEIAGKTSIGSRYNKEGSFQNGVAGVCKNLVQSHNLSKLVGVIIHEYTHGTYGNDDNTRSFENDLTDIIGILAVGRKK
jgi:flavin-binding protein dodecin